MIFFQKVLPVQRPPIINRNINRLDFSTLRANYINRDVQKTQIKQTPLIRSHQLGLSSIEGKKPKIEGLAPDWHSLAPFLNALTKCFKYGENNSNCLWILAWIKDDAISFENKPYKPLPWISLTYKYLTSNDPEKTAILQKAEEILVDSFLTAKDFVGKENLKNETFGIVGEKDYGMCVKNSNMIDVTYRSVDKLLRFIKENEEEKINYAKNFFKGAFAHEMTHQLRKEFRVKINMGQEIASHAVEILTCGGNNPYADGKFELAIKNHRSSYKRDMVSALKLVQSKLIPEVSVSYKPVSFYPEELNKAMESIPKNKRGQVLKRIAQEIINTPAIDLLK